MPRAPATSAGGSLPVAPEVPMSPPQLTSTEVAKKVSTKAIRLSN